MTSQFDHLNFLEKHELKYDHYYWGIYKDNIVHLLKYCISDKWSNGFDFICSFETFKAFREIYKPFELNPNKEKNKIISLFEEYINFSAYQDVHFVIYKQEHTIDILRLLFGDDFIVDNLNRYFVVYDDVKIPVKILDYDIKKGYSKDILWLFGRTRDILDYASKDNLYSLKYEYIDELNRYYLHNLDNEKDDKQDKNVYLPVFLNEMKVKIEN